MNTIEPKRAFCPFESGMPVVVASMQFRESKIELKCIRLIEAVVSIKSSW